MKYMSKDTLTYYAHSCGFKDGRNNSTGESTVEVPEDIINIQDNLVKLIELIEVAVAKEVYTEARSACARIAKKEGDLADRCDDEIKKLIRLL